MEEVIHNRDVCSYMLAYLVDVHVIGALVGAYEEVGGRGGGGEAVGTAGGVHVGRVHAHPAVHRGQHPVARTTAGGKPGRRVGARYARLGTTSSSSSSSISSYR